MLRVFCVTASFKTFGGEIKYTEDQAYSSSSIINSTGLIYNKEQRKFLDKIKTKELLSGEVGYIVASIRDMGHIEPGDTVTTIESETKDPIAYEAYYSFKMNDSVTVTPTIFYTSSRDSVATNDVTGFVHNSWLHPLKSRKVIVVGSEGMIVFDDTLIENQITVYEKGVNWDKIIKSEKGKNSRFEIIDGDYYSPQIETQEPLATEIQAVVNWIQLDKKPISDSKNGLEIVRILEKAQEGLLT